MRGSNEPVRMKLGKAIDRLREDNFCRIHETKSALGPKLRLKVEIKVGKLEVELGDNGDSGQK